MDSKLSQLQQAAAAGQLGNRIDVHDPNTGEVLDSFGSANAAYQAGVLSQPGLLGITSNNPVYRNGSGWTTTEPTTSSVTLDKNTGDINVTVPKNVANDKEFASTLETLKTYSGYYKLNPNATLKQKNDDGTTEELTVADYIERLNTPVETGEKDEKGNAIKISPFQSQVNNYIWANSVRDFLAPKYRQMNEDGSITAVDLSMTDLVRMASNGLGSDIKDTTRLAIPKGIEAFEKIYAAEDWDDALSTTSISTFKEWHNREKTDKQEILSVYGDLGRYLSETTKNPQLAENINVEKWTAAYALYTYLSETDPECSMFRKAWDVVGSTVNAAGQAAVNYAVEGVALLGTVAEKVVDTTMNLYETGLSSNPFRDRPETNFTIWAKTVDDVMDVKFFGQKWGLEGDFQDIAETYYEMQGVQKDLKGVLGIGVDAETATRFASEGADPNLNSGADGYRKLLTSFIQLGVAIHVGNVLSDAVVANVSKVAADLVEGSKTIETMVAAGMKSWVPIAGAKGVANVLNLTAKVVNSSVVTGGLGLIGETIGEALFQSPEVLSQILQSDDLEPEAQQYLWDTFVGNAWGLGIATTSAKAISKVGETVWGQAFSRNMRNTLWTWQAKAGDVLDGIRIKLSGSGDVIEWLDKIGSKGLTDASHSRHMHKEAIMAQQRTVRRARQAIAANSPKIKWIGESAEDILKQIDEADDYLTKLMEYEGYLDDILRGNNYQKLTMLEDHPMFEAADTELRKISGELVELQTRAGLKAADEVGELKLFANPVSEYVNAKVRTTIGESAIAAKKASKAVNALEEVPKIEKELAHWAEVIGNFEGKYGADLVAKANEYVDATKRWWQEFNTMRLNMGLIDTTDLAKWREEGIWGKNGELYARQQRKTEQSDYVTRRRDGRVMKQLERDMGHYNWGSTEEFVDPMLVAQQEFEIAAEQANRIGAERTYSQITGTATVLKNAEDVRVAREIKPYLKAYNNEANAAIKPLVNELEVDGVFQQQIKLKDISAESTQTSRSLGSIERQIQRNVTRGEAQMAIFNLDESGIEELWGSAYGTKTIEEVTGKAESQSNSMRNILMKSKEARESSYMKDIVIPAREQQLRQTVDYAMLSDAEKNLEVLGERMDDALDNAVTDVMDKFKETFFAKGSNAHKVADEVAMRYGGDAPDAVKDYLYYDSLKKNKANLAKQVKAKAKEYFQKYEVEVDGKMVKPYKAQAEHLSNAVSKRVSGRVEAEFNASRATMAAMGGDAAKLVDHDVWQKEIYETANEIAELKEGSNVIFIPNENGQTELVQVDPLLAIFVNSTTQYTPQGLLGRANYLWMRLFRLGTTGLNPTSWVNQYYRDLGNAWVMGNVSQTLSSATEELAEIFGRNASEILSQYSDEVQKNLLKLADQQNKSLAQVMAEREIRRGSLYAQASSESAITRLWRGTKNQWLLGGQQRGLYDKTLDWVDKVEEKATIVNETREKYLRNLVYGNNFAAAIKNGKSIEQARIFAEYIASNATTNFTRGVAFMSQFQNTIPYFRSAINGARSFYRLWSLDPVGVTGRIVGGLIIPAFALTMSSLSTEENRKAYSKIQAYQKEDALPIVMDGQAYFIPLPQELSAFIAPFRQAAEAIQGLGYNNGLEVIMSDLLALSPVDLGGFTDIDSWRIYGTGPSWTERLTKGGAQLFSQIMPKWAVAAATFATGRDLYTGNKIDTSYVTVDPETGEQQVMSYTAGNIANTLNQIWPNLPAPIAQEMLENIFGTAGAQLMNFLADITGRAVTFNFDYASSLKEFGEDVLQDLSKPMRPYVEARESADWRHAMSDLWDMKNDILSPNTPQGQAWQSMLTNKRNATTQTERDAVATARANILDPFHKQVMETVNKLIAADPTAFTDYKLGSVMSLLNFGTVGDTVNSAASESAREIYNQSKYAAVETMVNIGFPNVNQPSILGTIKYSQDGNSYIQWNTPLQILDMENTIYARGAIYAADIKNLLKKNGITTQGRQEQYDKYNATNDKAEKQKIAAEWDIKVMTAIAPYVQQYGIESIASSSDVIDLLDGYVMIPTDFTKYNGKSTYNPRNNITRGYTQSLIKEVFGAKK